MRGGRERHPGALVKAARRLARQKKKAQLSDMAKGQPIGLRVRSSDDIWFAAAIWVVGSKRQGSPIPTDLTDLRPGKKEAFWRATEALKDLDPDLSIEQQREVVKETQQRLQASKQKGDSVARPLRL